MTDSVFHAFDDMLAVLPVDRQLHSRAVGRKVASVVGLVPVHVRFELIVAGILHDIGYGHPEIGFHSIDGARFLSRSQFSKVVCHLVAHHSASLAEARERGIDRSIYAEFNVNEELGSSHAVLWWADMTTGPQGQDVTVEDRLEEIAVRYGPDDPVTRFIRQASARLTAAGQSPIGSIQVSD